MLTQFNKCRNNPVLRILLISSIGILAFSTTASVNSQQNTALSANAPRRVNIPYFSGGVTWANSAIFWFGAYQLSLPGSNYADVRVAYTADALQVRVVIVDYYLWYNENPQPGDDLTQYDAISIYLDTNHDRAGNPQPDDYTFLVGARDWQDISQYLRQGRGTGYGWDNTWAATWSGESWMQWDCNPGPNSNDCGIDYGWVGGYTIPWSDLGFSGPPNDGTVWGFGVTLYDRDDQPPAGYVAPEYWPETFNTDSPATWGEIHFGYANYQPAAAIPEGTTVIRAASPTDNTVEDSWMGGGGWCQGGHNGHGEDNHGDDDKLFVGTEIQPTHFPCYNKSYLRFSLDSIPPGKEIISATLTLHDWGNANPDTDPPSWVSLFTITDPWDEMTIQWNNSPLAQENVSASWIYPVIDFPGWSGIPYDWDATQAVADAYAEGRPASMAIYSSDTGRDTSKYLTSSEAGDWDVEGRPKLTVVWGEPMAAVSKQAMPQRATRDDTIIYTLDWLGIGQSLTLTDTLPAGLSDPGSLSANNGTASYDPGSRMITWTGTPGSGEAVTLTYTAVVQVNGPALLINDATLFSEDSNTTSGASVCVDCNNIYLPIIRRISP